jgi:hypothetical protein
MEAKEVKEICKQVDIVWNKLHTVLDSCLYWGEVQKYCKRHVVRGRQFSGYSTFDFPLKYEVKIAIIRQFAYFQDGDIPTIGDFNYTAMYIYSAYSLFYTYSSRLEAQNITVSSELRDLTPIGSK